ncbi:MAG TPA: hypothetical protein VIV14_12825 [Gammaproteobacteria bacterium]
MELAVAELFDQLSDFRDLFVVAVLRDEESEQQVDGLAVPGVELDRLVQPKKCADAFMESGNPRVRHGDGTAESCATETLAIDQAFEDGLRFERIQVCGQNLAEHLERMLLASGIRLAADAIRA